MIDFNELEERTPSQDDYGLSVHNQMAYKSKISTMIGSHNHDSEYAPVVHNHDSEYAPVVHNHDSEYAPVVHNHDADYSPIGHTHEVIPGQGAIVGEIRRMVVGTIPEGWEVCDGCYGRPYLSDLSPVQKSLNVGFTANVTGWAASGGTIAWDSNQVALLTKTSAAGNLYIYHDFTVAVNDVYYLRLKYQFVDAAPTPFSLLAHSAANFTSPLTPFSGYLSPVQVPPYDNNYHVIDTMVRATTTVLRVALAGYMPSVGSCYRVDDFEVWMCPGGGQETQQYIIYIG